MHEDATGHDMAEVHMDFMFMEESGGTLASLVVKERSSGMVMATVLPGRVAANGWQRGWRHL